MGVAGQVAVAAPPLPIPGFTALSGQHTESIMAKTVAELERELAELQKKNDELARRTTARTEPKKENYAFVPNGVIGEKQIEIPYGMKSAKFLPSSTGKRQVFTIQVQFPDGIKGQLVLTKA